jgi:hypothetical protein
VADCDAFPLGVGDKMAVPSARERSTKIMRWPNVLCDRLTNSMKVSFLHTLSSNQALFAPSIATLGPSVTVTHHVNQQLLNEAQEIATPDDEAQVTRSVHQALDKLVDGEKNPPNIIICTCSTIGDMADSFSRHGSSAPKVIRVDRPMALCAVQFPQIHVLAALESTIRPTMELLQECAKRTKMNPKMKATVIPGAWSRFQAGDTQAYVHSISTYIQNNFQTEDFKETVIVLAQASMCPAGKNLKISCPTPKVLTIPAICMEYLATEFQKN